MVIKWNNNWNNKILIKIINIIMIFMIINDNNGNT